MLFSVLVDVFIAISCIRSMIVCYEIHMIRMKHQVFIYIYLMFLCSQYSIDTISHTRVKVLAHRGTTGPGQPYLEDRAAQAILQRADAGAADHHDHPARVVGAEELVFPRLPHAFRLVKRADMSRNRDALGPWANKDLPCTCR